MNINIKPESTMLEILKNYPSAQRILFQKYHIGGCSHCGFSLDETLKEVFKKHNKEHLINEAIESIYNNYIWEKEMQISPIEFKKLLENEKDWVILDVREPFEREIAFIPDSVLLTRELAFEIINSWDRNTKIIFYCHTGIRSMEALYYFYSHGFKNVKNLEGGIDKYAKEVDPSIALY